MLTKDKINEICREVAEYVFSRMKFNAVKTIRLYTGWGLRESIAYLDKNWGEIEVVLRKDLMDLNGLTDEGEKPRRVFENEYLRVEVKKDNISFEMMNKFFATVIDDLLRQERGE